MITYNKKVCIKKMMIFAILCLINLLLISIIYMQLFLFGNKNNPDSSLIFDGLSLCCCAFLLLMLTIISKKEQLYIWESFNSLKIVPKFVGLALLLGLVWQLLIVGISYLGTVSYPHATQLPQIGIVLFHFFFFAILTPIAEELIFRKWLIDMMRRANFSVPIIIMTSSVLFFVCHLGYSFLRIDTLIGGVFLCILYLKSGDIRYPIIAHALNNTLATLFSYAYCL